MTVKKRISRRRLLGQAVGVALAGAALPACDNDKPATATKTTKTTKKPSAEAVRRASEANEEVGVGIIGCGRRNGQLAIGKGGQGKRPDFARIVAVADVFEALTADRPYREAYSLPEAAEMMTRMPLDQRIVSEVFKALPELYEKLSLWDIQDQDSQEKFESSIDALRKP